LPILHPKQGQFMITFFAFCLLLGLVAGPAIADQF